MIRDIKWELTFNRKDAIGLKIKISNKILKYDE